MGQASSSTDKRVSRASDLKFRPVLSSEADEQFSEFREASSYILKGVLKTISDFDQAEAVDDDDAFRVKMEMPGLSTENVKVTVENSMLLVIEGEEAETGKNKKTRKKYSSRHFVPSNLYKVGEIEAQMKHGVLNVVVPRVDKAQEENDVVEIKVHS